MRLWMSLWVVLVMLAVVGCGDSYDTWSTYKPIPYARVIVLTNGTVVECAQGVDERGMHPAFRCRQNDGWMTFERAHVGTVKRMERLP